MRIAWAGLLMAACSGSGAPTGQLVSGLGAPTALALDADGIDFVDFRDNAAYIGRAPKTGGSAQVLLSQRTGAIAASGDTLYLAEPGSGAVSSIAVASGALTPIGTAQTDPVAIAVDGADLFVGVSPICIGGGPPCPTTDQLVQRFSTSGGAPTAIVETPAGNGGRVLAVTADPTYVSWVQPDGLWTSQRGVPGSRIALTSDPLGPKPIYLAEGGGFLYNATRNSIYRSTTSSGGDAPVTDEPDDIVALAADDRGVYWLTSDHLSFLPHEGGAAQVLASGLGRATALAVDASGIYYATGTPGAADVDAGAPPPSGGIWRIAR